MSRTHKTSLALPKFDAEEKTLELRMRLKGKPAVDLAEYRDAYVAENGPIELEQLAAHILSTFIDNDRGFQAWRRARAAASNRLAAE